MPCVSRPLSVLGVLGVSGFGEGRAAHEDAVEVQECSSIPKPQQNPLNPKRTACSLAELQVMAMPNAQLLGKPQGLPLACHPWGKEPHFGGWGDDTTRVLVFSGVPRR